MWRRRVVSLKNGWISTGIRWRKCASAVRSNGGEACWRDTCEENWITAVTGSCHILYQPYLIKMYHVTIVCSLHERMRLTNVALTTSTLLQYFYGYSANFDTVDHNILFSRDGVGDKTCKAQSNRHRQRTDTVTPNFLQFGCTSCCPTNSVRQWRRKQFAIGGQNAGEKRRPKIF